MADVVVRPSSPSPSISLLEIKADTRLVLKSFLRKSLAVPPGQRPGRIGGEYNDPNKYSATSKEKVKRDANAWDSLDEEISAAEEKKHGIKNLIKRRLRPRSSIVLRAKKDSNTDHTQNNTLERPSQPGQSDKTTTNKTRTLTKSEDERFSPSSASEEEGDRKLAERNKKKKKTLKTQISGIFKKVSKKDEPRPQRPASLSIKKGPVPTEPAISPSHPPEFYDGVAETLGRIAQKHSVKKKSPVIAAPLDHASKNKVVDKEVLVQQLVQILTSEGDAINDKINSSPMLRSSLTRLSYPSFAKLLDTYASQSVDPPLPAPVSPTLRRLAITMDVSRRVVTATGVQQPLTGYAERYMESFAPWVRSHGGWENIVHMEEALECD